MGVPRTLAAVAIVALVPTTGDVGVSAGAAAPIAVPIDGGDGEAYTGIASVSVGDRCTASLIDTGVDDAPAYLLTNGHCAAARDVGANEVVLDDASTGDAVFAPFADDPDGLVTMAVDGVPYSTMKGRDITIAELDVTLGEARAIGLVPLAIAPIAPAPGDPVTNVGIPVQGFDEAEWVLRRGECTLGEQVDLIEFVWHFDDSWSNDCPGIRGGSSGSPLLDVDGRIVAMINTSTVGAPEGGDCYLGKPCERVGDDGTEVVADTSYAVPVAGVDRCFTASGLFDVAADGCALDPGGGVSARIDRRAVQPSADRAQATTTATISGPPGIEFATKVGAAGRLDCADPQGYGDAATLTDTLTLDVSVPGEDGMYVLCVAEPGRQQFGSTAVVQVDGTPPVVQPELSIIDVGASLLVEPIFAVPELSDFVVKVGPDDETDCAADEGYVRYRRIPFDIPTSVLPALVCVIGSDEAGNAAAPYSQLIAATDGNPPATPDPTESTGLEVSGVVRYLERIALPPDAVVTVRVEDVSLADAPATVIAEQVIEPTHQVPIPFQLALDPADLDERNRYSLRAQIMVDGELWWTSDTFVPVSATEPTTELDVVLVRVPTR